MVKCELVLSIEDDDLMVYDVDEGRYIIVDPENRKAKVTNNWIWLLKYRDFATRVDSKHKLNKRCLEIIKENKDDIDMNLRIVDSKDEFLINWQEDLLGQAKLGQKIIF